MEREIFSFIEENERIRRTLYNRDLEAERAKARNKQVLSKSEFQLTRGVLRSRTIDNSID